MNWQTFPWRECSRSFSARRHGTYARRYVGRSHPLADRSGMAYEHRLVALEAGLISLRSPRGKDGTHVHHASRRPKTVNRPELLEALACPTHMALPRRFLGRMTERNWFDADGRAHSEFTLHLPNNGANRRAGTTR